jgi:hypothetical protein
VNIEQAKEPVDADLARVERLYREFSGSHVPLIGSGSFDAPNFMLTPEPFPLSKEQVNELE